MIQIGGVYTTFCQEEGILLQKHAIEMGGVSRYFSNVLGSGVDVTFQKNIKPLLWPFEALGVSELKTPLVYTFAPLTTNGLPEDYKYLRPKCCHVYGLGQGYKQRTSE